MVFLMSVYNERVAQLRQLMREYQIDYYLVPSTDPHQSEYVPTYWQRRAQITGFTGSQGEALIGLDQAWLWTDSRYFIQAEQQLDPSLFQLMKQLPGLPKSPEQWLAEQGQVSRIGVDSKLISLIRYEKMVDLLPEGSELIAIDCNLIDAVISQDTVDKTTDQDLDNIILLTNSGQSTIDKLDLLRQELSRSSAEAMFVSTLDDIAWILNIRGQDIDYNPVVISYLWLTEQSAVWCVDLNKVPRSIQLEFAEVGIDVEPYEHIDHLLSTCSGVVWLDKRYASWWVNSQLSACQVYDKAIPSTLLKACKNSIELSGMEAAHYADGLAMVKFLYWLAQHGVGQTEYQLANKLDQLRLEHSSCRGLSFPTIMGYGENGAIVHYEASRDGSAQVTEDSLLLFDSGGQYQLGTTDVTRVVHLGQPTAWQKHCYTLVLKGHIALANVVFPAGTHGVQIDMAARQFLWQYGFDYGHGTGHGVGAYLCVHEGSQNISPALRQQPLLPGMVVSNEPGLYLSEQFGIRIENLQYVVERIPANDSPTGSGPFYGFTTLTLVPYDRNLIELSLLTDSEIAWLNHYHEAVYQKLSPNLTHLEKAWLKEACQLLWC